MKGGWAGAVAAGAMVVVGLLPQRALSEDGGHPTTGEIIGVLRLLHDSSQDDVVTCTGPDGDYREIRTRALGSLTSSDDRFGGDAVAATWILLNTSTLKGTIEADVEVRDPKTDAVKAVAHAYAVFNGLAVKGVLVGSLADGTRVVANVSGWHPPPVPGVTAHEEILELGGPTDVPVDLAMMQRSSCTGTVGIDTRPNSRRR